MKNKLTKKELRILSHIIGTFPNLNGDHIKVIYKLMSYRDNISIEEINIYKKVIDTDFI